MLVDEGWTLEAHVMGGIRPAMIARPHSQMLIISTMGTVESTVWNQIVARGTGCCRRSRLDSRLHRIFGAALMRTCGTKNCGIRGCPP